MTSKEQEDNIQKKFQKYKEEDLEKATKYLEGAHDASMKAHLERREEDRELMKAREMAKYQRDVEHKVNWEIDWDKTRESLKKEHPEYTSEESNPIWLWSLFVFNVVLDGFLVYLLFNQ